LSIRQRRGRLNKSSRHFQTTPRRNGCIAIAIASTVRASAAESRAWASPKSSQHRRAPGRIRTLKARAAQFGARVWHTSLCSTRDICDASSRFTAGTIIGAGRILGSKRTRQIRGRSHFHQLVRSSRFRKSAGCITATSGRRRIRAWRSGTVGAPIAQLVSSTVTICVELPSKERDLTVRSRAPSPGPGLPRCEARTAVLANDRIVPDAEIVVRSHVIGWKQDPRVPPLIAFGVRLTRKIGPFILKREYAAPDE